MEVPHRRCHSCVEVEYSPFYGIEKGAVLQEARMFNDRVVDARRCQQVLARRAKWCLFPRLVSSVLRRQARRQRRIVRGCSLTATLV